MVDGARCMFAATSILGYRFVPRIRDLPSKRIYLFEPAAARATGGSRVRGAFRAPDALCPMRCHVRQRGQLVRDRSRAVQHIQEALTQMNVQLDNVLSDIMGKTGQLSVRAIVAGERDGAALARCRDGRCKADEATIAASLQGNWRDEHLFAL